MTTPYLRRYYAGGGTSTNLSNAMAAADTSFVINSDTGWPGSPGNSGGFIVVVDRGTSSEEKIRCSSNSGTTVTVASDGNGGRGYDGTSATSHNANASVSLCGGAIDFDEANQVVTQVLGQSGAAKGDILAMLSAAGPNTLTRVSIGSNSPVLGVAAGLPAWQQPRPSTTLSSGQSLAINQSYKISGGSGTYVLPAPVAGGFVVVTNYGTGIPVVSHNASEAIYGDGLGTSGSSSFSLGTYGATATVESDGTSWYITAGQQDTGWITPGSFTNSWSNSSGVSYRTLGNMTKIRGNLGAGTGNTSAFTLNTGSRPAQVAYGMAPSTSDSSWSTVIINTNGTVVPMTSLGILLDAVPAFTVD